MLRSALVSIAAVAITLSLGAGVQAAPDDSLCRNRPTTARIDAETAALAKMLHDGNPKVQGIFQKDIDEMKKNDPPELASAHEQMFMRSLFCADPADVSARRDSKNPEKMYFNVNFWRANINNFYDEAKPHPLTPKLISQGNDVLNKIIGPNDRDQAVAQFNERAREDGQNMRINLNDKGELELTSLPAPNK